jgi:Adenylate and Guanylate cyclase catalytic domain
MIENQNSRTLICSVVFLDIVEYSCQPVAQQITLKDDFNALLSQALQDIAVSDRIILDTGDGAAISLIGDPEDALLLATKFRDAVAAQAPGNTAPLRARIGINLGPVRLVKDINGQPNIIGDGINVAQRVMSFAQPGQALVSRSYYEVVSRLSDDYSKLFHYEGSHTDKHVRAHEVYEVGTTVPGLGQRSQAKRGIASGFSGSGGLAVDYPAQITTVIKNNVYRKPRLVTALTVIAILLVAIVMRGYRDKPEAEAMPTAEAVPATKPNVAPPRSDKKPAPVVDDMGTGAPSGTSPKAPDRGVAVVKLAITPWGEVFVDGIQQGVSPPLRDLRIVAGEHKIEVRNPSFPSHIQTVNAKAGAQIRIKHKFH